MPIKRCTLSNGKKGYKYGDSGKCYASREDALKQMRAIKVSKQKHGQGEDESLIDKVVKILEKQIKEGN